MDPDQAPVARELFIRWQRARGGRTEASVRPFSRGWEDLLEGAGIVSATERADAERDARLMEAEGWLALKTIRYRPHLIERISIPLDQEARWMEVFGCTPPSDEEDRWIREHAWQPALAFLRENRVNLSFAELRQIDVFLENLRNGHPVVPIKERSLQIFGDEKRMDLLTDSSLFREGRLSLAQLGCKLAPEPLGWRRGQPSVPQEAPVLVVENCATWHSFTRWNETAARYRAVVYGRGNAFVDSVSMMPDLFAELGGVGPIHYFGDLDAAGIRIARRAHEEAMRSGLPAIEPALDWYRALLARSSASVRDESGAVADEADFNWMGELDAATRALLGSNQRLAQEHIGWEFLLGRSEGGSSSVR